MALDAFHIRALRQSVEAEGLDAIRCQQTQAAPSEFRNVYDCRSSSPPPRSSRRPGLGSSATKSYSVGDDIGWHSYRTGKSPASNTLRMRKRFVKATHLSDSSLLSPNPNTSAFNHTTEQSSLANTITSRTISSPPSEATPKPEQSLAQLYSQLTQDMSTSHPVQLGTSAPESLSSPSSSENTQKGRVLTQADSHGHRQRHHPDARRRSEWFISRALTKMRRAQHASPIETSTPSVLAEEAGIDKYEDPLPESSSQSNRNRCQRCGDTLPSDATPEYMARHRQSIGHRLGLNAPVSSASASEAPSPDASEPPTPAPRPRSSSPIDISLLGVSMQWLRRKSGKPPTRLSNAPRWKKIARDNVGHSLLSRMGWKEGMGLGLQEWKWQQLRREMDKRQRSNAVRALLLRQSSSAQASSSADGVFLDPAQIPSVQLVGSSKAEPGRLGTQSEWMQPLLQPNPTEAEAGHLEAAFPFQFDAQSAEKQREASQMWLASLSGTDAKCLQYLTEEEQRSLEQALISGHVSLLDVKSILLDIGDTRSPDEVPSIATHPNLTGLGMEAEDEGINRLAQSNALLYPVQVEPRNGRGGIGSKRPLSDLRRRSRDAEGRVEIRKLSFSADSLGEAPKKPRPSATGRPSKPPDRSRSHSGVGRKRTDPTRRQRELAYQKDKQDWLELRASLS
ncbi:uncharacterized protein MEPE_02074 [Melanopsichium pennsylvanicum]|uniref:G-patch domain-containing protein n=2 Tax=Melanopsichium pennsylvanicum TaxID=63383 RepID=A0AAJ4XJY8_9BASI|nr:putative protein [Melanopsichium pennsylvanicum 4]SNX83367.1 uncharacterized protein MEPE_02074 [Melanopsichium pennsylvanicum]